MAIDMVEIGNIENRWGVKAGDYNVTLNAKTDMMDFQERADDDLAAAI